ncbi:MAG: DUF1553 domain-containing protein [Planctomycetota bacterium]|nr:MAG: DUF1553 domain-containing protein [Planctomycetota bacterium]
MSFCSITRCTAPAALLLISCRFVLAEDAYRGMVLEDEPVGYWRFDRQDPEGSAVNSAGDRFHGTVHGRIETGRPGPRSSEYPDFSDENTAAGFPDGPNYVVVADPGDESPLDFDNGDALTMEAWVRWDSLRNGSFPYIIGKGRTHNPGTSVHNQNYSLRLSTRGGGPFISFFFCDAETPTTSSAIGDEGHRWTSKAAVPDDGAWHHIALTYLFGDPDSLRGYIDGEPVDGVWDLGGKTTKRPFVDNDELWIGSSVSGQATFGGDLDEVAIYRTALSPERIKQHARIDITESEFALGKVRPEEVPDDCVRVELLEHVPVERSWKFRMRQPEHLFDCDLFALSELPRKYDRRGLIIDRPVPWLLHLTTRKPFDAGEYEFVVRSLDAARLYIDGELVLETPFMDLGSDGHHAPHEIAEVPDGVLSIPAAHHETRKTVTLTEGPHVVSLYRLIGTKKSGARVGELVVGYGRVGEPLSFFGPQRDPAFTDESWLRLLDEEHERLREINQVRRLAQDEQEREYWSFRHELARKLAPPAVAVPGGANGANAVDAFINDRLAAENVEPTPLVDDFSFLRRLALDTIGVIPTQDQIDQFLADPAETRREQAIERFLQHPGWADHWTAYWQDVLAENPGLTKPKLNNTGPFRWFIYESFLDNKPFDRFVSELISMEGSAYAGGPAGFGMASENDVPMAAKAHIVGTAFLAVEMKCARCHDAPYHDVTQGDLFSLAALLKRGPQQVPGSSSVPDDVLANAAVNVSLKPGSSVEPDWPFVDLIRNESQEIPDGVLRNPTDTRERLAATLTLPTNERFARVIVNRLWQRYLGRGLIEPVDDWEDADCSHPELLDFLARELVTHNYDLKHVASLIFNSGVYQRTTVSGADRESEQAALFAGPVRRRLSAEQIVDSLYRVAGKPLESEELTMDGDGRRPDSTFLDLGTPRRAWEFAAVSNERDRPSMSLFAAQNVVDLMMAYGWRQQRQDPITLREETVTPLQPMVLANGTAAARGVDMTDHSGLTDLALEGQELENFVERLFQRVLTRPPTTDEREAFVELLADGYEDRIVAGPDAVPPRRIHRSPRTWTNHLHPEATEIALARQAELEAGDPPSARLDADWRQRAEDAAWVLLNLPEFVFVP